MLHPWHPLPGLKGRWGRQGTRCGWAWAPPAMGPPADGCLAPEGRGWAWARVLSQDTATRPGESAERGMQPHRRGGTPILFELRPGWGNCGCRAQDRRGMPSF